jgi:hypothetical protein
MLDGTIKRSSVARHWIRRDDPAAGPTTLSACALLSPESMREKPVLLFTPRDERINLCTGESSK